MQFFEGVTQDYEKWGDRVVHWELNKMLNLKSETNLNISILFLKHQASLWAHCKAFYLYGWTWLAALIVVLMVLVAFPAAGPGGGLAGPVFKRHLKTPKTEVLIVHTSLDGC